MNATVLPLAPSLRDRLAVVLSAIDFSLTAGHCVQAVKCDECRNAAQLVAALNAEVAEAVARVRTAETGPEAIQVYLDCLAGLAGLGVEAEAVR